MPPTYSTAKPRRSFGWIWWLLLAGAAWYGYKTYYHPKTLADFAPTPQQADIMAKTAMTDKAKLLFLEADPQIETRQQFAINCNTSGNGPNDVELGCYYKGKIHLLQIDNPQLADLTYVTAAHEMLHAAYAQLNAGQQRNVDSLVEAQEAATPAVKQRLAIYKAKEPGELDNELHSILGTEYSSLSPQLETYYSQYFAPRTAVVAAEKRVDDVSATKRAEINSLKAQIDSLKARIAALKAQMSAYEAQGDIRDYNANVPVVNSLISQYNAKIAQYNQAVDEYNNLYRSLSGNSYSQLQTESSP